MGVVIGFFLATGATFLTLFPLELKSEGIGYQNGDAIGNGINGDNGDVVNTSSLRMVQVIFRHGDRTPIHRFPLNPYEDRAHWPEGWGQLTNRGKKQQYQLGQYLRKRYDGFLGTEYVPEEMYVQTSFLDRTIQSAEANLAGLWPATLDDAYVPQYVPLHSIPAVLDNKIVFRRSCPKYEAMWQHAPLLPSARELDSENKELYSHLSENTGLNVTSYFNVSDLYDTLLVHTLHNFSLPNWAEPYFPDKLRPFIDKASLSGLAYNDQMLRMRAGPLLHEIVRDMKRVIERRSEEEEKDELIVLEKEKNVTRAKFHMYSGHDTTIVPVLAALNAFDGKHPPYCSSLYFELHQDGPTNSTDVYHVKVLYRSGLEKPPIQLSFNKCKRNDACSFEEFFKIVEPFVLDEMQWVKECQSS